MDRLAALLAKVKASQPLCIMFSDADGNGRKMELVEFMLEYLKIGFCENPEINKSFVPHDEYASIIKQLEDCPKGFKGSLLRSIVDDLRSRLKGGDAYVRT